MSRTPNALTGPDGERLRFTERPPGLAHAVLIPDPEEGQAPLFGIESGWHNAVALLRTHKHDPDAVQYIADMME